MLLSWALLFRHSARCGVIRLYRYRRGGRRDRQDLVLYIFCALYRCTDHGFIQATSAVSVILATSHTCLETRKHAMLVHSKGSGKGGKEYHDG